MDHTDDYVFPTTSQGGRRKKALTWALTAFMKAPSSGPDQLLKTELPNIPLRTVVQLLSCVQLCEPMDCSTPGLLVHHQLLELAQPHVH